MPLDVAFVRLSLDTMWHNSTARLIWRVFPDAPLHVIDGRAGWPNVWFKWLDVAAEIRNKILVLVDEDFFVTGGLEFKLWLEEFAESPASLSGVPDAFHPARYCNPLALNPSLLAAKRAAVARYAGRFDSCVFDYSSERGWSGGIGVKWPGYLPDLPYELSIDQFRMQAPEREHEFYYQLYWLMLQDGHIFQYLYPRFDAELGSCNPLRMPWGGEIGIHMFCGRCSESAEPFLGVPNVKRYQRLTRRLLGVGTHNEGNSLVGL